MRSSAAKPASDRAALLSLALALTLAFAGALVPGARAADPGPPPAGDPRATPASPETVREVQATLARARERFEARDTAGVLAYVSEQYRSGPLTKAMIREQLLGIFGLYEAVRARVTIDAVDMVDGGVRVYTTGEVSGRLPLVKSWVTFLWWAREPEVARREGTVWRLFGFHDQPAAGCVSCRASQGRTASRSTAGTKGEPKDVASKTESPPSEANDPVEGSSAIQRATVERQSATPVRVAVTPTEVR